MSLCPSTLNPFALGPFALGLGERSDAKVLTDCMVRSAALEPFMPRSNSDRRDTCQPIPNAIMTVAAIARLFQNDVNPVDV